jgi:uncharacterized protein YbbK (DUF523 family)
MKNKKNMEKILVSACLVGDKVRYDSSDNYCDNVTLHKWISEGRVVAVCPEVASGLSIPRPPVEIAGPKGGAGVFERISRVLTKEGKDVSGMYIKGAEIALDLSLQENIRIAILKAKSPSCGSSKIYDGCFNGTTVEGDGVTASLLKQKGVEVYTEEEISVVADRLKVMEGSNGK